MSVAGTGFGGSSVTFAANNIGGVNYPVTQIGLGSSSAATVWTLGRQAAAASAPTALSTEDLAAIQSIATALAGILQTALASSAPLPAGTNNIGDVDVLTVPQNGRSFLAYNFAAGLAVTASSTSAVSAAPAGATAVTLVARTSPIYFTFGSSTAVASSAAGSFYLPANLPFTAALGSATHIAYIRDGSSDAQVTILGAA